MASIYQDKYCTIKTPHGVHYGRVVALPAAGGSAESVTISEFAYVTWKNRPEKKYDALMAPEYLCSNAPDALYHYWTVPTAAVGDRGPTMTITYFEEIIDTVPNDYPNVLKNGNLPVK